jgi:hypothetical protein
MKTIAMTAVFLGIVSCATTKHSGDNPNTRHDYISPEETGTSAILPEVDPITDKIDPTATKGEKCQSCGAFHRYAATFDELDYSLIADFCDGFNLRKQVLMKAPHGPTPACSSTYDSNLSWDYLHKQIPELRRETFDSFKRRNNPIPIHESSEALAVQYGIDIVQDSADANQLSRGGFSGDREQALIYSGRGVIHLFQRKGAKWEEVDSCVLWIS